MLGVMHKVGDGIKSFSITSLLRMKVLKLTTNQNCKVCVLVYLFSNGLNIAWEATSFVSAGSWKRLIHCGNIGQGCYFEKIVPKTLALCPGATDWVPH